MERRTFIGTLLASLGALTFEPTESLLWMPTPESSHVVAPEALITLEQITKAMLKHVRDNLQVAVPLTRRALIGSEVHGKPGHVINHQYHVAMMPPDTIDRYGLDSERYVQPAAAQLAHASRGLIGCGAFGNVIAPNAQGCVVTDFTSGLSLRGLRGYDVWDGRDYLRFDILVAQ